VFACSVPLSLCRPPRPAKAQIPLCQRILGSNPEPVFVNLFSSPGIDSQAGGPVLQPSLTYRPARLHWLAESIPWNRFLGSLNVYNFRALHCCDFGIGMQSDALTTRLDLIRYKVILLVPWLRQIICLFNNSFLYWSVTKLVLIIFFLLSLFSLPVLYA
jgi:hypothetical protein